MNSQSIDVKIAIYEQANEQGEDGYQAKIKTNVLDKTIITDVYSSAVALFNKGIDPVVKALRIKALQNQRGFTSQYKNFVKDKDKMLLSGLESTLEDARIEVK